MFRFLLALALAFASQWASAALNLNTASKEELVALSGIGAAKAQAIIDYRVQHGGFKTVDELKEVKGIGARRFEKLKSELTVSPVAAMAASCTGGVGSVAAGSVPAGAGSVRTGVSADGAVAGLSAGAVDEGTSPAVAGVGASPVAAVPASEVAGAASFFGLPFFGCGPKG